MRASALRLLPLLALAAGCGENTFWRMPDPAVRVIAFGDSTTRGPADSDYVDFLPELTAQGENRFANEGRSGETTAAGVERLRAILDREYYPNATTLLYWEGGNDLIDYIQQRDPLLALSPNSLLYPFGLSTTARLDVIQANIEAAIRLAKEADLRVFVATYFYLPRESDACRPLLLGVLLPPQSAVANDYVALLNERIELAATKEGATLIDVESLSATLREGAEYYYNCTHLSTKGNKLVATLFSEAIQDATAAGKNQAEKR